MDKTLFEMLAKGMDAGTQRAAQQRQLENQQALETQKGSQESDLKKQEAAQALAQMFAQGKQSLANKAAERDLDMKSMGQMQNAGLANDGGSIKAGDLSAGSDPYAKNLARGQMQSPAFLKEVQKAYQPITKQLDAARTTLDSLDQRTAAGDKMALINEGNFALGGSGSRALGAVIHQLTGDPTMESDVQKAVNWANNTPHIPTMTEDQRDSLRESIFSRSPQLAQQHQAARESLMQQGPLAYPMANTPGLVGSVAGPVDSKINQLKQREDAYKKSRSLSTPNNPVSSPSAGAANPSTLDKLRGFLGGSPQASPAGAQTKQGVDGKTYTKNPATGLWEAQ